MDNQILFMTTKKFTSNLELIVFAHFLSLFIYSHVETLLIFGILKNISNLISKE
jgi:hypothetical protein